MAPFFSAWYNFIACFLLEAKVGARSTLKNLVLFTIICVCIPLSGCNRNPAHKNVKAGPQQTTPQKKVAPPIELWRKQVATRPIGDGTNPVERLKGKTLQDIVNENGWSIERSPILLDNGSLLCVTSSNSQKELGSYQHLYPGMERLTDPYASFEVYRLIVVGSDGKITKHQKFLWTNNAYIAADPSGKNLAIVAVDEHNTYEGYELEGSRLIGLDFDLSESWVRKFEGGLGAYSLVVGEKAIYICSRTPYDFNDWGENRGDENELNAFDKLGNPLWTTNLSNTGIQSTMALGWSYENPMSLGNSGSLFLIDEKGNLISISNQGDLLWSTFLDCKLESPPLQLPSGKIVLIRKNFNAEDFWSDSNEKKWYNTETSIVVLSNMGEKLSQTKLELESRSGLVPFGNDGFVLSTAYWDPTLDLFDLELGVPSRVICLESSGTEIWQADVGSSIGEFRIFGRSIHVTPDNQTYLAGESGKLFKLDQGGEVIWNLDIGLVDKGVISVGRGRIYFYSFSGDLVCYEER